MADGTYQECAAWAYSLIVLEREREEKQRGKAANAGHDLLKDMLNKEFIELVRREFEEGQSHE